MDVLIHDNATTTMRSAIARFHQWNSLLNSLLIFHRDTIRHLNMDSIRSTQLSNVSKQRIFTTINLNSCCNLPASTWPITTKLMWIFSLPMVDVFYSSLSSKANCGWCGKQHENRVTNGCYKIARCNFIIFAVTNLSYVRRTRTDSAQTRMTVAAIQVV